VLEHTPSSGLRSSAESQSAEDILGVEVRDTPIGDVAHAVVLFHRLETILGLHTSDAAMSLRALAAAHPCEFLFGGLGLCCLLLGRKLVLLDPHQDALRAVVVRLANKRPSILMADPELTTIRRH